MRKSAIAVSLFLMLGASVAFTACGSDSSSSSDTTTATVPTGKLGTSVAPAKLGTYQGMECHDSGCSRFHSAKEGIVVYARAFCGTASKTGVSTGFKYKDSAGKSKTENYVCFKRNKENNVTDFWYAGQRIKGDTYSKSDQFPQTCENGWCVDGEWHSTTDMSGHIRNPQSSIASYEAEWVG